MKVKFPALLFCLAVFFLTKGVIAQAEFPKITAVWPEYAASDVDTTIEISLTFSLAMDRKSVETNFYIYPKTKGRFRWEKNKLIFKPYQPLSPSTTYVVSFAPQVKDTNGSPLILTYFTTIAQGLCVGRDGKIRIVSKNNKPEHVLTEGKNPVWSLDNRSIIYDDQGEIWRINNNRKHQIQLTDEKLISCTMPVYNPGADIIAFVGTNSAQVSNVYTLDPNAKIVNQLTAFFQPESIDVVRWSPDGLYLAFLRAGQIWIINQDGNDLRKLTTNELTCNVNFAWSPGGTKIAFVGDENIWVGNIYSLKLRKVSFDNLKTGAVDWSKKNKIVFECEGLTIMDADGSNEIQIVTAGKNPVWINSGDYLSFILPLYNKDNFDQLWIMSADGLKKEKIADINSDYNSVSWSKNVSFLKSPSS